MNPSPTPTPGWLSVSPFGPGKKTETSFHFRISSRTFVIIFFFFLDHQQFNLDHRKCEDYRGTRFYNKNSGLVMKRWLNRVEEDVSGLTFQEWTP
jgi:hypothetical protein